MKLKYKPKGRLKQPAELKGWLEGLLALILMAIIWIAAR